MIRKAFFKVTKKIVTLALAAAIVMQGSTIVRAEDNTKDISEWLSENGRYVYPLTPKDPEWQEMEDYLDKAKACKIPQEVLENMSDEQLVQAIIDYPLIYDVFFFSDVSMGVDHFSKTCDAYAELLKRQNAKDILLNEITRQNSGEPAGMAMENNTESVERTAKDEIILDTLVAITIFQEKIGTELSEEEIEVLTEASTLLDIYDSETMSTRGTVTGGLMKTPGGLYVGYQLMSCSDQHPDEPDLHTSYDSWLVTTYGVTLVSPGDCSYNCHSYAWYNQSTNNDRWINDPSPYMQDGSCTKVMSGTMGNSCSFVVPGDIVVYGGLSHSAIVIGSPNGEPFTSRMLISKWGPSGVFMHRASQVPRDVNDKPAYDVSEISVWRR